MYEIFSDQSESTGIDLLNRLTEWSKLHSDLLRTVALILFVANILLIVMALLKREWILQKLKVHDLTEKLFIGSFFASIVEGLFFFTAIIWVLGLPSAEPVLVPFFIVGTFLLLCGIAALLCFVMFVILAVRLFIIGRPLNPIISDEVNWGGTPILVVAVAFFVISFISTALSAVLGSVIGSLLFIALPLFLVLKPYKRPLRAMGFRKPVLKILVISLPLIPLLVVGSEVIYQYTERVMGEFPLDELTEDILSESPIIMSIYLAVAGPVGEEVFFRGFAHTALKRKYGFKKGIFFSSLFFGIYHGIPWQIPYAFVAGLVLAYVYEKTQSLYAPILFHIINNSVAVIGFMI